MNPESLISDLNRQGIEICKDGNQLRYRAQKGAMTPEIKDLLGTNKNEILAFLERSAKNCRLPALVSRELQAPPTWVGPSSSINEKAPQASVTISGKSFTYLKSWQDQVLAGQVIAFDTETSLIQGEDVPTLALASASSGQEHCLIHPTNVGKFILAHRDRQLVFQNVPFDFWVIVEHLKRTRESDALACWWKIADDGLMHDTMILDMLVRLAANDTYPVQRNLAVIGQEYAGMEISKEDPYRLRYGEIIGKDWSSVDPGFFSYAIKDPIVTWHAYQTLYAKAKGLAERAGVTAETIAKYGLLSETIQVKGAIALSQISRHGIHLNLDESSAVHSKYLAELDEIVKRLRQMPGCEGVFKTSKKTGELVMTKGQAPSTSQNELREVLTGIAATIAAETGKNFTIPQTPKGDISVSTKDWGDLAHLSPFIENWIELQETAKLCQFFTGLQQSVVHPSYSIMVRTGRTSANKPNIQQIPRKGGLREIFVPSPGHLLLAADYSFIELRTLAAVCEARYGRSTLADVIRKGVDPHCYTAALLLDMEPADFMGFAKTDPAIFKQRRQQAKPLNFGIPGGLGASTLVQYARSTYGVEYTLEEAQEFRNNLINDIYPELGTYLSEDRMDILARNLGVPVEQAWWKLDWKGDRSFAIAAGIYNIIRGKTVKNDGQPYHPRYLDNVWRSLAELNRNPEMSPFFANRVGSEDLAKKLFWSGVSTLTGRSRGRVSFCQARNTPFQGLAADGAKLALWNLVREGIRVIGFVHDEVLVELPDRGGYVHETEARKVEEIMCRSMQEVSGSVPIACEFTLARCWSKDAKAVIKDGRIYP